MVLVLELFEFEFSLLSILFILLRFLFKEGFLNFTFLNIFTLFKTIPLPLLMNKIGLFLSLELLFVFSEDILFFYSMYYNY